MAPRPRSSRISPESAAEQAIRNGQSAPDSFFEVKYINHVKGKGLFTKKQFKKGDFVIEYEGILSSGNESLSQSKEEYIYEFTYRGKTYRIDATRECFLARFMNDDNYWYNVRPKVIFVEQPTIAFFAVRDIDIGEEVTYDYGPGPHAWRTTSRKRVKAPKEKKPTKTRKCLTENQHGRLDLQSESHNEMIPEQAENLHSQLDGQFQTSSDNTEDVYDNDHDDKNDDDYNADSVTDESYIPDESCGQEFDDDNDDEYDDDPSNNACAVDCIEVAEQIHLGENEVPHGDQDVQPGTLAEHGENGADVNNGLSIALKNQMQNITIPKYYKIGEKRNYSKTDVCLFCKQKLKSKISGHIMNMHSNEERVKEIILMPKGSLSRRKELQRIQNDGNFLYNCEIIKKGEGELIVGRRPSANTKYTAADFLPCTHCHAFFLQSCLWQHVRKCPLKVDGAHTSNMVRDGQTMLAPLLDKSTEDEAELFSFFEGMKETNAHPGLKRVCSNDALIKEFGRSLLERLGSETERRFKDLDIARTKVRTLGRLLSKLNENQARWLQLADFLCPARFNDIIKATRSVSSESDSPKLALNLGHYIKHCFLLKISIGIQKNNESWQKDGKDFQYLYESHWNNKISCVANRRMRLKKLNKPELLPLTEDIIALKDWLTHEIANSLSLISPSTEQWRNLAQWVMARVLIFNKRRIAEVMELTIADYQARSKSSDNEDILCCLDTTEQAIAKRMSVVEVRGKSTRSIRKVYIVLTEDMEKSIDFVIKHRPNKLSPYVFSRESSKETPLDGCHILKKIANECPHLKHPERINSTKLRKYMATTTQLMEMKESEIKMIADHLGHNLNIHTDVYKLQTTILERSKVARILMAAENGLMTKYQGQPLEAISFNDLPLPVPYDKWVNEGEEQADESMEEMEQEQYEGALNIEVIDKEPVSQSEDPHENMQPTKMKITRRPWTTVENDALRIAFKGNIEGVKKVVTAADIRSAKAKFPALLNRSDMQIRVKINNIMKHKCNF